MLMLHGCSVCGTAVFKKIKCRPCVSTPTLSVSIKQCVMVLMIKNDLERKLYYPSYTDLFSVMKISEFLNFNNVGGLENDFIFLYRRGNKGSCNI